MLNKLKVIALLLLLSLLSGCNGTTGSGSQETTKQGNRQPANTTSVPTAKADNPSLSAGNAVRVARWSKDPKGLSLLVPLEGTLAIVNNCLVVKEKDIITTVVVFPYHKGVWDGAKRTFTYEGKVIRIGERISVGGAFLQNLDQLKPYGKYDVPDCGINIFFQTF